jgi:UDP-N-acetylglucosamine--N-acetylmuramyl-(pentapeptide) pyrophosphoryl-undecaprenol N-acetylglucosamine transferase
MAGGTGGHIFPALAVAEQLSGQGVPLSWLGARGGMETDLVPKAGYRLLTVSIAGVRGKSCMTRLLAPFRVLFAISQSLKLMLKEKPGAVLGMGGFASGPGGLAAWLLRVPLLIHEQNAIAGFTNQVLSRLATRVLEAFPGTFPPARRAIHTGNPVRRNIVEVPPPAARFAGRKGPCRLLVIGGSQGAEILNQVTPVALAGLTARKKGPGSINALIEPGPFFKVWHQAGAKHAGITQQRYADQGVEARVAPFIENMAEAYAWADLVLCRAGALTVSELAAVGVAAILVPFPGAVDDHQTANARYLAETGAAKLVPQPEFTPERLAELIDELTASRAHLKTMAEKARTLTPEGAAERVAALCLEVAHG